MLDHSFFSRPLTQVVLLGIVCLCCPGMFNALSGLGAGGSMSSNVGLVDAANGALYGCFAVVGFLAGSVTNAWGVKTTLTLGSISYTLYSVAFWVYDRYNLAVVIVAAGATLGCCAALFWTAQGAIMMSYPEEQHKGKYVAIFWSLFNLGGILGSIVALVLNLENESVTGVSTATYTVFVIIMLTGVGISVLLLPPSRIVRSNGTPVVLDEPSPWISELRGAIRVFREWRILALSPAFLASNWFYAYQFRINAMYFDTTTRALNDTMYWTMQVIGSGAIGCLLDYQGLGRRRARGLLGLGIMFVILMSVWAGGYAFQLTFDNDFQQPVHWTVPGFGGPFTLYMLYGMADALYQTYLYWLMGAMSNDPQLLARYAGFYKAIQSIGAAIAFGIDAVDIPLQWECLICWLMVFTSFPPLALVVKDITESSSNIPKEGEIQKSSETSKEL